MHMTALEQDHQLEFGMRAGTELNILKIKGVPYLCSFASGMPGKTRESQEAHAEAERLAESFRGWWTAFGQANHSAR